MIMRKIDYVNQIKNDILEEFSKHPEIEGSVTVSAEGLMPINVSIKNHSEILGFFADAAYSRYAHGKEDYKTSTSWFLEKVQSLFK